MTNANNEAYKRITGRDMPKPWAERTEEEKIRAREAFIASIENSTPEEDAAVDEFIAIIEKNLAESRSRVRLPEDVDAA
jgi:hypothetical protein